MSNSKIKIAMVDDHILLRNALAGLINSFEICQVIYQANNGLQLIKELKSDFLPDVVILDLNMPEMNGFETAIWLKENFPSINVLMLTMYDSDLSLIRLLQAGVKGFLKKDIHPDELKFAIQAVVSEGYYYSNHTTGKLASLFRKSGDGKIAVEKAILTEVELNFLRLVCTDLTYKEVAQKMNLNPRTIDTLRDQLFVKMDVKSRVGLAMLAIKHGIVTI